MQMRARAPLLPAFDLIFFGAFSAERDKRGMADANSCGEFRRCFFFLLLLLLLLLLLSIYSLNFFQIPLFLVVVFFARFSVHFCTLRTSKPD